MRRTLPAAVATLCSALLVAGCGGGDTSSNASPTEATVTVTATQTASATATATATVTATATATPTAPAEPTPASTESPEFTEKVKASGFNIKLKIRSQECFGSAGCLVNFQIDPKYVGGGNIGDGSYDVTYEVLGGEDGPVINTFTINNGRASYDEEEMIGTPGQPNLTARVTAVYKS